MEIIVIETNDSEESRMIKAVLKALKVRFKSSGEISPKAKKAAAGIRKAYQEMKDIEAGNIRPKSFDELLNEL